MSNRKTHIIITIICFFVVFLLLNSITNLITITVKDVFKSDDVFTFTGTDLSVTTILFNFNEVTGMGYIALTMISLFVSFFIYYKLRLNFKRLEDSGSKGTSRFSTLKEIKQQFKAVPEKKKFYAGGGGVPISRYKNKIYVDDSPVNNLWIGTTRSGKGEMGVFPMIDIYSRAEEQASMIINDPKGELYTASKQTLEERGYHVEVLNLENPLKSMSYNLLQI